MVVKHQLNYQTSLTFKPNIMATFKIVLDTRNRKKDGTYNLSVRITNKNDVMFSNITSLTKSVYEQVFVKNTATDESSIKFREDCNKYKAKCERVFNQVQPFDKKIFRQKMEQKEKVLPNSLLLRDLISNYITTKDDIKIRTKKHYKTTLNVFETFMPGASVQNITTDFLKKFEKTKLASGCSLATINSYNRNLRSIINYYRNVDKIIPASYEYPFGRGGYSISSFFPAKMALDNDEIKKVITFTDFTDKKQEYALAIWKILYYSNGSNFIDILKLKWTDINKNNAVYIRTKTELTRKNNKKQILIPIIEDLQLLLDQHGDKNSDYVLGKITNSYSETMLNNKCKKMKAQINKQLNILSEKLDLSVPLRLKSARDCYGSTLLRSGASISTISRMYGHSNVIVTEHYLTGLNPEESLSVNQKLITR